MPVFLSKRLFLLLFLFTGRVGLILVLCNRASMGYGVPCRAGEGLVTPCVVTCRVVGVGCRSYKGGEILLPQTRLMRVKGTLRKQNPIFFLEISRKFPGYVQDVFPENSKKFPGVFLEMS